MDIISDVLLGLGALAAAIYCLVLSRRLRRFNNLQSGMGGAVAVLSAQVDDMTKTLEKARGAAGQSASILSDLTERAEQSSRKLELLMASLHDLPEPGEPPEGEAAVEQASEPVSEDKEPDLPPSDEAPKSIPMFSSNRRLEAAE
ncbi:hypothetical protein [Aliiroseovarius marinus]|uniref:hypothetical protein n=1 Tax=Aliiroseovarius marinus TaxID=2500159 RepID=UPI003D7C95C3